MSAERRNKDKAMAAHLKERGVRRTSGACPMGCGRGISNGGEALITHLNTCKGSPRVVRNR